MLNVEEPPSQRLSVAINMLFFFNNKVMLQSQNRIAVGGKRGSFYAARACDLTGRRNCLLESSSVSSASEIGKKPQSTSIRWH